VIDGTGLAEMDLPSARQATLEHLSSLMDLEPHALPGPASLTRLEVESLAGEVEARHLGSLARWLKVPTAERACSPWSKARHPSRASRCETGLGSVASETKRGS
jgi:hypothetical protein